MVDVATYYQYRKRKEQTKLSEAYRLRSDEVEAPSSDKHRDDDIGPARVDLDEFPDTPELLVFPRTVIAYDLRRKTWSMFLRVAWYCSLLTRPTS